MESLRRLVATRTAVIVVLIFVGGTGIWWWRSRNDVKLTFRTAPIKRGTLVATIAATGTIEPVQVVDVGAQVAGRISSFGTDKVGKPIDYGSVVAKGAVLIRIDDSVYAADLAVAKAQLQEAKAGETTAAANLEQMKAKLAQAEADWKRTQELSEAKLIARDLYDSGKANYEVSKSNVTVADAAIAEAKAATVQAQAAVERAQRNLDFCTITSPVDGVIIDRRVNIGQTVVASLNAPSLFLIAQDLTKMQIWVSVNEADVGRIKPGTPVTFTCAALPGRQFEGVVDQVRLNATMTQNIVIYTVVVNTQNPDNVLLPYLTANVNFVVHQENNTLLVPNSALRWEPSSLAEIAPDVRSQNAFDPQGDALADSISISSKPNNSRKENRGVLWVKDGHYVRPLEVNVRATDGVNTAIAGDHLREGLEVVTGESVRSSQAATKNPFVPVLHHH
ncbi:MAG TPA: efflux RND transporter periplasmic adaptor subunit [Verrucomicrobiae bacterium]|nr:efflux RND transporter periplasmic adaptor subunit [Verrucomicrobiae bacterium]